MNPETRIYTDVQVDHCCKELRNRLKELRKQRGLSQANVAALLKIDRSTYSYYELGRTQPNLSILLRLASYYNVTIDYLLDFQL